MKRLSKIVSVILSAVSCFGILAATTACGNDIPTANVVKLSDNGELLTNPNMGWNFTYYANTIDDFNNTLHAGDYLDEFPCDICFFRIGWNWIEPQEGQFNWDFIDDVAKEWISRGKRIALCFVVTYPGDQSTPLWVRDEAGAQGQQYYWMPKIEGYDENNQAIFVPEGEDLNANGERELYLTYMNERMGRYYNTTSFTAIPFDAQEFARNAGRRTDPTYNGGNEVAVGDYENYRGTWVPDYEDPIFLEKWENFMKACVDHYEGSEFNTMYDGDPDHDVDFIEMGSFGDWGEQHATNTPANPITMDVIKTHFDLYARCWKKTQVMMNDNIANEDVTRLALERGFGVSDHSVQLPNGYEGGEDANASVAREFYQKQPVLLENHNGTMIGETYYNGILDCYATWARINCDPNIQKFSEWTEKITLRLGYRLNFTEVAFDELALDRTIRFAFKMKNTGTAYCYEGGNPTFYLIDKLGRIRATAVSSFNVNTLKPNKNLNKAEEFSGTAEFKMPTDLREGDYYICVSVTKGVDEDGQPIDTYKLPLNYRDGERLRYRIAKFTVS